MCVTLYHLNKITYEARKFKFKPQLHCKLIVQPSVYCLNCVNLPFLIYGMKNNTFPPPKGCGKYSMRNHRQSTCLGYRREEVPGHTTARPHTSSPGSVASLRNEK